VAGGAAAGDARRLRASAHAGRRADNRPHPRERRALGVAARAVAEGIPEVEVYRARLSAEPRAESAALEGERLSASALLEELRAATRESLSQATLGRPGSGLSIRLT
jgi:hypothetical protein